MNSLIYTLNYFRESVCFGLVNGEGEYEDNARLLI